MKKVLVYVFAYTIFIPVYVILKAIELSSSAICLEMDHIDKRYLSVFR